MRSIIREQTVPANPGAEEQVIGACLLYQDLAEWVVENVPADAFYAPKWQFTVMAMEAMISRGDTVTPVTVYLELQATEGAIRPTDHELAQAHAQAPARASAKKLAGEILDCAARRRVLVMLADVHEALNDPTVGLEKLVEQARLGVQGIDVPVTMVEAATALEDFLAVEDEEYDWVVPGLLERGDRLILTGGEGQGKSTFLRQMCMSIACNRHPFTERFIDHKGQPQHERRVLIIDAENTERQLRRALRPMWKELERQGYPLTPGAFRIKVRPEGLDLRTPADVRWVYEQVEAARPDVLYIGPLYKLGAVGNDEEPAKQVIRVLDTIRKRWNPVLLMETHSPHGESGGRRPVRPIGASIWMRWPEFGYGITPDKEDPEAFSWWTGWRGPRDQRDWPKKLIRRGGALPWAVEDLSRSPLKPPPPTDDDDF